VESKKSLKLKYASPNPENILQAPALARNQCRVEAVGNIDQ